MSADSPDRHYYSENSHAGIPRIALRLLDHKTSIAINWTILLISSGILPIALYFALRYGANMSLSDVLAITTAIFGAVTLFSLGQRSWRLMRVQSTCRPIGASRWALDYFHWNFMFGFLGVTALIVAGNVVTSVRITALGLPVLLVDVCSQLLIVGILRAMGAAAPFRISSVAKGERIRSGVYAIVEDIVAVDGNQQEAYRRQLQARYLASSTIQALFFQLDLIWGISGLCVAGLCFGLIFGLPSANAGYVVGWAIPWGYAGVMTLVTIYMTKDAIKKEKQISPGSRKTTQEAALLAA